MPKKTTRPSTPGETRAMAAKVRRYLEALEASKTRRGRKTTPDQLRERIKRCNEKIETAGALQLAQQRHDLERRLKALLDSQHINELERDFIAVARAYGERVGIGWEAWREMDVPVSVLSRAGIVRSR